ncbi:MAG TPA: enoyl-CoA hydratase/isomerase family protein [Holophagaceae bacterium]|jgi:enoyl-CoA hydratase|nr:enoyl-CoA hydratase/isomerase family protein [Holophagaceae bacterium]
MNPVRAFEGATSLDLLQGPGWAWIGMDSADGLHRLHSGTLLVLDALMSELRFNGVRRVALSASGWMKGQGRHFSAGADLHEVAALAPATADAFSRRGQRVMRALLWPGWRSLTLISGVAMGGGCDLALHGQERWCVEGLRMAHPAAKHGILTGFGGTARLPELLGARGASRLFAGLEHWNERDALEAGAVQRILAPEEAREASLAWLSA